jgi:hypothetical protein
MGERGQILIKRTGVYLYTHWNGDLLKVILYHALKKKWRWTDDEYLARIIFDVMTKGEHNQESGYGIGTVEHTDLGYPLLEVDCEKQKITEYDEKKQTWTFEGFLKFMEKEAVVERMM